MTERSIDELLTKLLDREKTATSSDDLVQTGQLYDHLATAAPGHIPTLLARNRFRLMNPDSVPADRPRVLVGGMNDGFFPNFHTVPLLRIADVVSLTTGPDEGRPERVSYNLWSDRFSEILTRLPAGFEPDFFFDNQIVGFHFVPIGLEEAPFPTVGSLCHVFRSASNLDIAEHFDVLLPISKAFIEPLRKATGKIVLDLPFGLNWGSFHELTQPAPVKDVDVSCTIGSKLVLGGHSPLRHRVHTLMQDLEKRYGDRFNFVISDGLPRPEYFDLLQRSRISINVDNFHGPYNYRNCEIMNSGALCLQVHEPNQFAVSTDIGEYFDDGEEIVVTTLDQLEDKLVFLLENREECAAIAAAGQERLETEYSYDTLYRRLFTELSQIKVDPASRISTARAYYTLGANYFNYEDDNHQPFSLLAIPGVLDQEEGPRLNNLLVLGARLSDQLGAAEVLPVLANAPEVAKAFMLGTDHAITAIRDMAPNNLALSWNACILGMERGLATADGVRTTLAQLDSAGSDFEPRDYLFVKPRLDYLTPAEEGQIHAGLFQHRVVAAYGERSETLAIHREYMRWHCLRWLYENDATGGRDYLTELLSIWGNDSVLQVRLAERLKDSDAIAAREAYSKALGLDPASEDARIGLAGLDAKPSTHAHRLVRPATPPAMG